MTLSDGLLAAVDLGSNSFHLLIARESHGELQVVDSAREMVRLGAGLQQDGSLTRDARQRALDCLERFGQRLRDIPRDRLRVVGTNTLRASHDTAFQNQAEAALGHEIEVISGIEEARLVYLGAAHSLAHLNARRLVVDIGGGSTELIIGEDFEPQQMQSLYMGCVSFSQRFFPRGKFTAKAFEKARLAALQELRPVRRRYRESGWQEAVGTSGTIRAVRDLLAIQRPGTDGIDRAGLAALVAQAVQEKGFAGFESLPERRRGVFAGGLAVLQGVFDSLKLDHLRVADGGLREGVLWDLLGQLHDEDVRERGVAAVARRLGVDQAQAERVAQTAGALLDRAAAGWALDEPRMARMLRWAALLHEIGLAVAYSQYHKHGGYFLRHANLSGFSLPQQAVLASLVAGHRRRLDRKSFQGLPAHWREPAFYLTVLLRLAVVLNRGRSDQPLELPGLAVGDDALTLRFARGWVAQHPLTVADLAGEAQYLQKAGVSLRVKEAPDQLVVGSGRPAIR